LTAAQAEQDKNIARAGFAAGRGVAGFRIKRGGKTLWRDLGQRFLVFRNTPGPFKSLMQELGLARQFSI